VPDWVGLPSRSKVGVTYNNGTSYQYDINGNITHKSDIGFYRYNTQKPHAIASINSNSPWLTDDYSANTATTGILAINSSVTGNISVDDTGDWFKITLTAGQQVTFDLEGRPTQSGTLPAPYLRGIYDNTGTLISGTTNDDGSIVNSKLTFTANTSNTYYISAGAYSRYDMGTYTLTATVTGSNADITPIQSDDYIYDANGNMTKNKPRLVRAGMMGSSGSLARQSPWRLCPKAVYAMRSTMLPCPLPIPKNPNQSQ
jgi:hypothetical protein